MTIRSVAPGRGWQWIVAAFQLFRKNPLIWLVLNMALMLIGLALSLLPVIGAYVLYLLTPVFLGGIMTAAKDQDGGQDIEIAHLFRGFRHNAAHLVTVGGVYLVGQVVISGVMLTLGGPEFQDAVAAGIGALDAPALTPEGARRVLQAMLVGTVLFVPLAMAVWFAPALVILGDEPGFQALWTSLLACLRNVLPMLLYSIVSSVLLVFAVIPFGLGLIVWIPVMLLTIYTSYRDVFVPVKPPA
ncbi:MAG: BPSS1780 family membrane protein [Betaproteobacteria bacterium]